MKRVIVFAHYDPNDRIDDYVIDYLAGLQRYASAIIVVSTAKLSDGEKAKLKGICNEVIVRVNEGYDFMSWRLGIHHFGRLFLGRCDELVLCNDSCYASPVALQRMFQVMDQRKTDFWGVTESFDYRYHIQSYFVVFRASILKSQTFWKFFDAVAIEANKVDTVKRYEVGLTAVLARAGFAHDIYIRYPKMLLLWLACRAKTNVVSHALARHFLYGPSTSDSGVVAKRRSAQKRVDILWIFLNPLNVNITLFDWRRLMRKGSPFLKTTVPKSNVYQDAKIGEWRRLAFDHGFPVDKIQAHLDRLREGRCPGDC